MVGISDSRYNVFVFVYKYLVYNVACDVNTCGISLTQPPNTSRCLLYGACDCCCGLHPVNVMVSMCEPFRQSLGAPLLLMSRTQPVPDTRITVFSRAVSFSSRRV